MGTASVIFGGIGLFLLGMSLMTDGLKALAGDTLKQVLSKFTGGLSTSIFSGTVVTAIIQSSSATILMTIGFVSAGLLTFPQSIGVIIGANLGSTSTGWIVSSIGFKVSMSMLALPLIAIGAFLKFFSKGRYIPLGLTLAGFGLLFLGIDILQEGMSGVTEAFNLEALGSSTLIEKLILVLIGLVMTILMQSSSAAVVITLAALVAEAISFEQAAILGIGQNVGTTVKAFIASIGGTVAAKRTALAHICFNLFTGLVAFICLPFMIWVVFFLLQLFQSTDVAVALALFHTLIYVVGLVLIVPFLTYFMKFIARLLPEQSDHLVTFLDSSVATIAPIALEAARRTLIKITKLIIGVACQLLRTQQVSLKMKQELEKASVALGQTREFLALINDETHPITKKEHSQQIALVHVMDHLQRLLRALEEPEFTTFVDDEQIFQGLWKRMEELLTDIKENLTEESLASLVKRVEKNSQTIAEIRRHNRKSIFETTVLSQTDVSEAIQLVHTLHWIDRLAYHLWRSMYHLHNFQDTEAHHDDSGE